MTETPGRLEIPEDIYQVMLAHLTAHLPEEACGLLGGELVGSRGIAGSMLAVENVLHSPVRFRMAPVAQLEALLTLERAGLELLAIFHSHPNGPEHPSATDRGEFLYPGVLSLICVPNGAPRQGEKWGVRAFAILGVLDPQSAMREVPLVRRPARGETKSQPEPG